MFWPFSTYFTTNSQKNSSYIQYSTSTISVSESPLLCLGKLLWLHLLSVLQKNVFCLNYLQKVPFYCTPVPFGHTGGRKMFVICWNVCRYSSILVIQICLMLFQTCKRTLFIHNMTFTATAIKFYLKDYPFKEELMFTVTVCQF